MLGYDIPLSGWLSPLVLDFAWFANVSFLYGKQRSSHMKLFLFLAALIWTVVVYNVHQAMGYERAIGHPPAVESAAWAVIFSIPAWTAFFTYGLRSNVTLVLRWFSAVGLIAMLYFLLGRTWLFSLKPFVNGRGLDRPLAYVSLVLVVLLAAVIMALIYPELRLLLRRRSNKIDQRS